MPSSSHTSNQRVLQVRNRVIPNETQSEALHHDVDGCRGEERWPSNTLIPSCSARLSLRVAPGQDPAEAAHALVAHLESHAPFGAHVSVEVEETGPAFKAGEDTPATVAARWALEQAWGTESVDIGVGGSIPFIADLAEVFPKAEILVTGIEDPDTRAHSQNESLHLGEWRNAILAEAALLARLGGQL